MKFTVYIALHDYAFGVFYRCAVVDKKITQHKAYHLLDVWSFILQLVYMYMSAFLAVSEHISSPP